MIFTVSAVTYALAKFHKATFINLLCLEMLKETGKVKKTCLLFLPKLQLAIRKSQMNHDIYNVISVSPLAQLSSIFHSHD